MDDTEMQDRILSSEGLVSTTTSASFDHGSLPIRQSNPGVSSPAIPQARSQGFAFTTAPNPFNHDNPPIRPGNPGTSQGSSSQARPADSAQSNAQATPVWYDRIPNSFGEPTDVAFVCAKGVWDQLGLGDKTPGDMLYYFEHKHYPARSVDDLEVDTELVLTPKSGSVYTSPIIHSFPAPGCATVHGIFKRTKKLWRIVYQQSQSPYPADGVFVKNLTFMVCDTHGDNINTWKSAPGDARYLQWYHDHVIHGRSKCLKLRLFYTEPVDG